MEGEHRGADQGHEGDNPENLERQPGDNAENIEGNPDQNALVNYSAPSPDSTTPEVPPLPQINPGQQAANSEATPPSSVEAQPVEDAHPPADSPDANVVTSTSNSVAITTRTVSSTRNPPVDRLAEMSLEEIGEINLVIRDNPVGNLPGPSRQIPYLSHLNIPINLSHNAPGIAEQANTSRQNPVPSTSGQPPRLNPVASTSTHSPLLNPVSSSSHPPHLNPISSTSGVPPRANIAPSTSGVPPRANIAPSTSGVPPRANIAPSTSGVPPRANIAPSTFGVPLRANIDPPGVRPRANIAPPAPRVPLLANIALSASPRAKNSPTASGVSPRARTSSASGVSPRARTSSASGASPRAKTPSTSEVQSDVSSKVRSGKNIKRHSDPLLSKEQSPKSLPSRTRPSSLDMFKPRDSSESPNEQNLNVPKLPSKEISPNSKRPAKPCAAEGGNGSNPDIILSPSKKPRITPEVPEETENLPNVENPSEDEDNLMDVDLKSKRSRSEKKRKDSSDNE